MTSIKFMSVSKFLGLQFFIGFMVFSTQAESLPETANLEYPCFVRYDAQSGLGKLLTGRSGKEPRNPNYYLVPPMAKAEKWTVVTNSGGVVYCTGANGFDAMDKFFGKDSVKGRHALWKSEDGNNVYLYDFNKNRKFLVWSRVEKPSEYDTIWVDHINHLAWSEKLYTTKADPQMPAVSYLTDRLVTYQDALDLAKAYSSLGIGDGMWELPASKAYSDSSSKGLTYFANGFLDFDSSKSSGRQSYRNWHWVKKPANAREDLQITFCGDQNFFSNTQGIFNSKDDVFYARFVISGDNFTRLQSSGVFPANEVIEYKEAYELEHSKN